MIPNQQHSELKDLLSGEFNKNELHPILWRGIVIDTDQNGNKFPNRIKGAIKVRIIGLHNYIDIKDERTMIPVALPMFFEAGFRPSLPQEGDWVFVMFENIEPIGQSYWLTTIPGMTAVKTGESVSDMYRRIFNL